LSIPELEIKALAQKMSQKLLLLVYIIEQLYFCFEFGAKYLKLGRNKFDRTSIMHIGKHNNEVMNVNEPILSLKPLLFR